MSILDSNLPNSRLSLIIYESTSLLWF